MGAQDWVIGFNKHKIAQLYFLGSVVLWSIVFLLVEKQGLAGWGRQADDCFSKNSQICPALVMQTPRRVFVCRRVMGVPSLLCE